ncbi:30S ribosomal protein S9 [Desulfobacca acetoxidans]|uniref:Small ribosomal subunit protein uS9 n=1 Tax=Desulfobacca acetoxidans (strain ATCC 700848 / DSM 11109 / ASRB2) TaxID=880072 RepID=F2NBV7_DESAR|nr:30S ribosomal protein S9 [Desulfobacca acetoxidans]AEB08034.1 ribosomal protein S9 [Desulfobacca acetoxidans DSM 11109]HAY20678.1 30S ribosomal protein S9 [Desulfobacterales bacterium]
MAQSNSIHAVGKRKNAIARIYLKPGTGKIMVNDREFEHYFPVEISRMIIRQPLELVNAGGDFDIYVNVQGGGMFGQAGAIKHGISKALLLLNSDFRPILKKAGFLTRDARIKERKKYGQRGARARYQYSKR